ncbi:DUF2189 domain-containing protein [Azohydromonas sediminis]|uniref:DUF2189 domain-containing protein n=1 Tax=Azohydromonas sediminis TaxID=2259674 RepID=UPI000E64CA42|nr:DUF2189 domain-containing protein [Azohydromonas sediminis]
MTRDAAPSTQPLPIRPITLSSPWRWLSRGWDDFARCPGPGLIHGAALAVFGAVLFVLAYDRFWLLAGAFSGFLLLAPVLATGLYAISRGLERGERVDMRIALRTWRPRDRRLVVFGVLLAAAGTGWVLTSAALITVFADAPVRNPRDFLHVVVLAPKSLLFEAWLVLGGALAAPVFASSVVAIPLLLDRPVGIWRAVLTSWRAVVEHPLPLALWAAILMTMTAVAIAAGMVGLLVAVPWLAHASWHAYRDLVDTTSLPESA